MMEGRGVLRSPARAAGNLGVVSVSSLIDAFFDTPGPRCGSVLSVHRSAVNLVIDGAFVTIASAGAGGLPNGVLVADPFDPRSHGVRSGLPVTIANGRLAIDGDRLVVAPGTARRWRPELEAMTVPGDLGLRAAIATRVAAGRPAGLDGIASAAAAFAALATALASVSDEEIVRAGRDLVGLGAGLTPAGDDVLVGLTAGLTALGDGRARGFAQVWAQHAIGRTTVVAEAAHRHAAGGAYSERIHDVLGAILNGPPGAIPVAVEAAAAWGATSGVDTLAGILLALEAPAAARAQLGAA